MALVASLLVVSLILALAIVQVFWPSWTTTLLWFGSLGLVGSSLVSLEEAQRSFGGSAVLTLATLMLASKVLIAAPLYTWLCTKAHSLSPISLCIIALLLSSVLNNIPVFLAITPVLEAKGAPAWTFVHLSHACALGGLLTPLGTSSHFIANDLLEDFGKDRLTLCDFLTYTPSGVVLGYLASLLLTSRMIPSVTREPSNIGPPSSSNRDPAHSSSPSWVILPLLILWIVFSFLQELLGISQWLISGSFLGMILLFGLVDRETPWTFFRGQTLVFTALSILIGIGVKESGLGKAILEALDSMGGSSSSLQWLVTALAVVLLTQLMHNSIIISIFIPSLLDAPQSILVGVTSLGSLSLCLAAGYPLNELVLHQTGLDPKALILPSLGVVLLTTAGCFLTHWF